MITHQQSNRLQSLIVDVEQAAVEWARAMDKHHKATAVLAGYILKLEKEDEEAQSEA